MYPYFKSIGINSKSLSILLCLSGTNRKDEEALLKELGPISYPNDTSEVNIEEDFSATGLPIIDLATLIHATNNFSNENKLGEGGFGPVYKVCSELSPYSLTSLRPIQLISLGHNSLW